MNLRMRDAIQMERDLNSMKLLLLCYCFPGITVEMTLVANGRHYRHDYAITLVLYYLHRYLNKVPVVFPN